MERISETNGCPYREDMTNESDDVVLSTNWDYLASMKMNVTAPSANMGPVTHPNQIREEETTSPWFWPDNELAKAVKLRQATFLENQKRILKTSKNDPIVRAASQQLLWLQSNYLADHFPDIYMIEENENFGPVITNKSTDDQFAVRPEKGDWHPLAISGMLGQEDICLVQRKKAGRQVLVAGFLATPTHWNLSNFLNADMDEIHRDVSGYHMPASLERNYRLKDTVDKTLEKLREYPDGIIARNNQFVGYNPSLALEPDAELGLKADKVRKNPGDYIYLRSERETLTRLPAPYDDFAVFTIKPNVFRMSDVRRLRGADFARAVATNAVLRESLKSDSQTKVKKQFDFIDLLQDYLNNES